jgi:hypothetical protein
VLFNTIADVPNPEKSEDWTIQLTYSWMDEPDRQGGRSLTSDERLKLIREKFGDGIVG